VDKKRFLDHEHSLLPLSGRITITREKRVHILLAEAPPANGQTRSHDGRQVPALPLVQRNLDAVDITALFLRRSNRPCAIVQWLLCHQCGSYDPPLSERLAPGVRSSPDDDTCTRGVKHSYHKDVDRAALALPSFSQPTSRPALPAHRSGECLRRSGVLPGGSRAGLLRFQVCVELNDDVVAERV